MIKKSTITSQEMSKNRATKSNIHFITKMYNTTRDITYCIISTANDLHTNTTTTYGVGVLRGKYLIDYVLNVSPNYHKVLSLVNLCNEEELDPIHLRDVIEDSF